MFDPTSTVQDYIPTTKSPAQAVEELKQIGPVDAKLLRKIDLRLIPILGAIYFIIFLDQVNLANASILGLTEDLQMPANGFNYALWIFYIPLFFVEVPSNVLLSWRRTKPRYYIGTIIFVLGILSMCQGLTRSYGGLLAIRFLMGMCEAAFPSAAILLIGSYYAKEELPVRFAFWFSFALIGSSFGGLLAYALNNMKGIEGMEGWRWMFVIEGLLTITFAISAAIFIPNFPHEANFLIEDERTRLINKLVIDRGNEKQDIEGINWIRVIFDYKKWLLFGMFFCNIMTAASIASFSPTILTNLGWTAIDTQLVEIPIWWSGVFAELGTTFLISRYNLLRWPFVMGGILLVAIGWILNLTQVHPYGVRYFALYLMAVGSFAQCPVLSSWMSSNLRGRVDRGVGSAMLIGYGNGVNLIASNVFISSQSPRYPVAFGTGLGMTLLGLVLCGVTVVVYTVHNRRLEKKLATRTEDDAPLDDQVDYKFVM